jgi:hypothetical protein
MSQIDLTPVFQLVLSLVVGALGIFGSWAFAALARKLGMQVTQQQQDLFDSALHKLVTMGASKSMGIIEAAGWNHPSVKDAILREAINAAMEKFPDAMKGVGIELGEPNSTRKIRDALERVYPLAMTSVVASPVTPTTGASPVAAIDVSTHEVKT